MRIFRRGTSANMTGYLKQQYPNAKTDYRESMEKLREACIQL